MNDNSLPGLRRRYWHADKPTATVHYVQVAAPGCDDGAPSVRDANPDLWEIVDTLHRHPCIGSALPCSGSTVCLD